MARLGIRTLRRADRPRRPARHAARHRALEGARPRLLAHLLPAGRCRPTSRATHCETQDHGLAGALDHELIAGAAPALEKQQPVRARPAGSATPTASVGAMLSRRGRASATATPGCPTTRSTSRFDGHRRAELRRVPRARRHLRAAGRDQRLRRQGPVRRAHRRLSRPDLPGEARGEHRHRQHGDVRRDRRRGVLPRRRRRALLRAQLGRRGGRRGHRRPRLRVHDRRHRRRARAAPAATSRRA